SQLLNGPGRAGCQRDRRADDMDTEVAQIVLAVITAVGTIVWLISLQFLIASARGRRSGEPLAPGEADHAGEGREGGLCCSAEVEAEASTLASRAAAILAKGDPFTFGPVKILEKTDDNVRFERADVGLANQPAGWFRRGELRFAPQRSGRTSVQW